MKNKTLMALAGLGAFLLTVAAQTTSASACAFGWYQPNEPKLLREK